MSRGEARRGEERGILLRAGILDTARPHQFTASPINQVPLSLSVAAHTVHIDIHMKKYTPSSQPKGKV